MYVICIEEVHTQINTVLHQKELVFDVFLKNKFADSVWSQVEVWQVITICNHRTKKNLIDVVGFI